MAERASLDPVARADRVDDAGGMPSAPVGVAGGLSATALTAEGLVGGLVGRRGVSGGAALDASAALLDVGLPSAPSPLPAAPTPPLVEAAAPQLPSCPGKTACLQRGHEG